LQTAHQGEAGRTGENRGCRTAASRPILNDGGHLGTSGDREGRALPVRKTGALGPIASVYVHDPDDNLIEISNYGEPDR
jgi:hypothetical protein